MIVRSSVNVNAGVQSRLSAIVHGVLLLVSVFALTGLINLIPLASLEAILIHTGLKLAKPALFRSVAKLGPATFAPFIATIAGVLAVDPLFGIALGLACSVLTVALANLKSPVTLAQHDDYFLLYRDRQCVDPEQGIVWSESVPKPSRSRGLPRLGTESLTQAKRHRRNRTRHQQGRQPAAQLADSRTRVVLVELPVGQPSEPMVLAAAASACDVGAIWSPQAPTQGARGRARTAPPPTCGSCRARGRRP
ncbi:hypothetical protein WK53_03140 [Burkholderia ubonensis]|uniref:SLC26A/SulP transporter domain-containing protein n=1 Tax=Burkholderia ubonensis TaxID=101571 RepID=A0AAW3NMK2_9BURK|nr:hypothetical protein WK53_03140 [Burkholderia ubonensis]